MTITLLFGSLKITHGDHQGSIPPNITNLWQTILLLPQYKNLVYIMQGNTRLVSDKHCSGVVIGCIYINQLQHNWYNTLIGLIIHYGQLYTKLYSVDIYNRLASHSYIQHQVISTPPRPTLNLLHQHSLAQHIVRGLARACHICIKHWGKSVEHI